MKKTVSLVLSILMILGMIVIPTAAEKTALEQLDENLIIHYDFEGSTFGLKYGDKSTGGSSADSINKYDANTTVENGVAHVTGTNGIRSEFVTTDATATTLGADFIKNNEEAFTFYLNYRVVGDGKTSGGMRDCFRISVSSKDHLLRFYTGNCNTDGTKTYSLMVNGKNVGTVGNIPYDSEGFVRVAISMQRSTTTETDETWNFTVYLSTDGGVSYTAPILNQSATVAKGFFKTATQFSFGNRNGSGSTEYYFDDIRVYNQALNGDQLKLIPNSIKNEEGVSKSVEENLIVHYDFEGIDLATQLSDKAPAGTSKENINVYNTTAKDELTVTDGVAHIKSIANPSGGTNSPYYSNGFTAQFHENALTDPSKSGADIVQNTTGEYTFYINFNVKGDGLTTGGFRDCFRVSETNSSHLIRFYAGNCNTTNKTKTFTFASSALAGKENTTLPYEGTSFFRYAVTMKWNETTSQWDYKAYLSKDNGKNYTSVMEASAANAEDYLTTATMLTFGSKNVKGAVEYYFDDIRIYNKALSVDELPKGNADFDIAENANTGAILHGIQTSVNKDSGTYSVRFVGSVDSLNYKTAGFTITAHGGAYKWDMPTAEVYQTLLANTDSGIKEITAASMRGEGAYLYALSITDIPVGQGILFVVSPYTVKGGQTTYGTRHTIVFNENGICTDSYQAVSDRTHHSWVEWQIADKFSQEDRDDVALIEKLIARMEGGFAVKVGSSNVLYNGKIVKTDVADYTKVTKDVAGDVLVAEDFATTYFTAAEADADGYVNISELCGEGKDYSLYYADGLAIVMPTAKAFDATEDADYIARMIEFYNNTTYLPEPTKPVEQTRKEIVSINYNSGAIADFTTYTYVCYGSPEILVASNGTWYMTYDINEMSFAGGQNYAGNIDTKFFKSTDKGETWDEIELIEDLRYVAMIEHDGKIILMGNRKSKSLVYFGWYDPTGEGTYQGQEVTGFDRWGSAATSIVIKDDRIYRAYNYAVVSADLSGADWTTLWTKDNWVSTAIPKELITETIFTQVTGIDPNGWGVQEGNVVLVGDEIYAVYRIDASPAYGYAAVFTVSADGKTLTPATGTINNSGIIAFPGNQSMFQIKQDANGNYISFVSVTTGDSAHQRNVLYMITSKDLVTWTRADAPVLVDRAMMNNTHSEIAHAFQYVSFDFVDADDDGAEDDIVLLVRESYGDSCNYHNANAITMYTVAGYADYLN